MVDGLAAGGAVPGVRGQPTKWKPQLSNFTVSQRHVVYLVGQRRESQHVVARGGGWRWARRHALANEWSGWRLGCQLRVVKLRQVETCNGRLQLGEGRLARLQHSHCPRLKPEGPPLANEPPPLSSPTTIPPPSPACFQRSAQESFALLFVSSHLHRSLFGSIVSSLRVLGSI